MTKIFTLIFFVCCLLALFINNAIAADANVSTPRISIIIDDLGNNESLDLRVIHLPGDVTCSFLPFEGFTRSLAEKAHENGKEVMLHVPMQAIEPHDLGKGGLKVNMTQDEVVSALLSDIQAVPYIQGINNHMGSLMTQHRDEMGWVMATIKPLDLYFVDSLTSHSSIAEQVAEEYGISTTRRDIFLDDQPDAAAIDEQFHQLIALAKKRGHALAIGHPYPATIRYLENTLPELAQQGVELVSVSQLIQYSNNQ